MRFLGATGERVVSGTLVLATIVGTWELFQGVWGVFPKTLAPPPHEVLRQALLLISSGELFSHASQSIRRAIYGYAVSVVSGIGFGIVLGLVARVERALDLFVNIIRSIPPLSWIPMAILWFGIGEEANVFIVWIIAFWPIYLNTFSAVRGVDRVFERAALTLGATRRQVIMEVILPSSLPSILTGLRISLGIAWASLVAAEFIAATSGLGFLILAARELLFPERVVVGMLTIGLLGLAADRGFLILQKRLLRWQAGIVRG